VAPDRNHRARPGIILQRRAEPRDHVLLPCPRLQRDGRLGILEHGGRHHLRAVDRDADRNTDALSHTHADRHLRSDTHADPESDPDLHAGVVADRRRDADSDSDAHSNVHIRSGADVDAGLDARRSEQSGGRRDVFEPDQPVVVGQLVERVGVPDRTWPRDERAVD